MTSIKTGRRARWLAPVAVAALLVGGTLTVNAVTASAGDPPLAPRSAAELLTDVQQAKLGAMSGTVVQSADLGFPDIPGLGGGSSAELTSLVSGTHTLRVWYDGVDKARVAVLGTLGESDIIRNGTDVWTWSSRDNSATHRTVPADDSPIPAAPGGIDPTDLPVTPEEAADAVLSAVGASTVVTTDASQTVAGRPVYQLTLQPRDAAGSLISSVTIAIDAEQHLPLRVQIFSVARVDPAFEVAFTSVDFSPPDPAQFTFNPPPGAQITEIAPGEDTSHPDSMGIPDVGAGADDGDALKLVGTGWTTVAVVSGSDLVSSEGQLGAALTMLPPVSGEWGTGHLFTGTLFSAVVTDDGRIAVGAVQPDLLYAALAG